MNSKSKQATAGVTRLGPRTRRGGLWLIIGVSVYVIAFFVLMWTTARQQDASAQREFVVLWLWISSALALMLLLFSLVWVRYRLLALRLWLSGVRGRYVVALVGATEKLALAALFGNPDLAQLRGMGIVITVSRDGLSVWHHTDSTLLGVIPWLHIESIRAVDAVRYSRQSPELQFAFVDVPTQISLALVSVSPLSIPTLGLKRLTRLAAQLRADGDIQDPQNIEDVDSETIGRGDATATEEVRAPRAHNAKARIL